MPRGLRLPTRRSVFLIGGVLIAAFLLWLVVGTVRVLTVRNEAHTLKSDLHSLRAEISGITKAIDEGREDAVLNDLTVKLQAAHRTAAHLHGRFTGIAVAPLRMVPWVGRQVASAGALASAAQRVTAAGETLTGEIQRLRSADTRGADTLTTLRVLDQAVATARREVDSIHSLGPSTSLQGSLRSARSEASAVVTDLRAKLADASTVVSGLRGIFEGPRNYLFVAANNSEMVAGSGRYLEIGWMHTAGGKVSVSDLRDTNQPSEFIFPGTVKVADRDVSRRWGWLDPGVVWTTLSTTPRFPATAPIAADMWAARTGKPVDGVVVMDVDALAGLVRATGPVTFDGKTYDADGIREELLHHQYTITNLEARHVREQRLTQTIIDAVRSRSVDPFKLVHSLRDSVLGRHLYGWSKDTHEESFWRTAHADGAVNSTSILPSVINLNGKLDHTLSTRITPTARPIANGVQVDLTVSLHNSATGHEPPGFSVSSLYGLAPSTYVGIVSIELPGAATHVEAQGQVAAVGSDGNLQFSTSWLVLPPGASTTRVFRFDLPSSLRTVTILPSSRDPGITWTIGQSARLDDRPFALMVAELPPSSEGVRGLIPLSTPEQVNTELQHVKERLGPLVAVDLQTALTRVFLAGRGTGPDGILTAVDPPLRPALRKVGLVGLLEGLSGRYALTQLLADLNGR